MKKKIPLHSLVLMVGPSGAGKSTITSAHFADYEVVSSDSIRAELVGDFQRQDINPLVFDTLHQRVRTKLAIGERVVVDATHLRKADRTSVTSIGVQLGVPVFYIVVNRPLEEKLATAGWRSNVPGLIERHDETFRNNEREILMGDHVATVIDTRKEEFEAVSKSPNGDIARHILDLGYKGVMVLGDIHGMRERLKSAIDWAITRNLYMIFLGDVIDYGPHSLECVDIVYDIMTRGRGAMTIGNHEKKIERWIAQDRLFQEKGIPVKLHLSDGNRATTNLVQALSQSDRTKFESKFATMVNLARNHILLGDNILLTHGGAEPEMFRITDHRLGKRLEGIALYGETDQTVQRADGYPNRVYNWVNRIPEGKKVIVGHDIRSTLKPLVETGTRGGEATFMDTGSGKGGHLTTAHIIHEDGVWDIKAFTAH
ncbi:diadenosine tetraphosphatase [compost metagenome]